MNKKLSEESCSVYKALLLGKKTEAESAILGCALRVVSSEFNYRYKLIGESEVKRMAEMATKSITDKPKSAAENAMKANVELTALIKNSLRQTISATIVNGIKSGDRRIENRVFGDNESDPWCIHKNVTATYYKYGGMNNKLLAHNHITPTDIKAWVEMRVRENEDIEDFFGFTQKVISNFILTHGSPKRHATLSQQLLITDSFEDEIDGKPMFNELCAAVKYSPIRPDEKSAATECQRYFNRFLQRLTPNMRTVLMDAAYGTYDDDKALAKALSTSIGNVYTLRKRAKTMFRKYLDNLE